MIGQYMRPLLELLQSAINATFKDFQVVQYQSWKSYMLDYENLNGL